MRKILLCILLSCLLAGCDQDNVRPRIIGVGTLQYDKVQNCAFTIVDSVRYDIKEIADFENETKLVSPVEIQQLIPEKVTVYKTSNSFGVKFALGEYSAKQVSRFPIQQKSRIEDVLVCVLGGACIFIILLCSARLINIFCNQSDE